MAHGAAPSLRSSTWGRLLIVPDAPSDPAGVRVTFAHPALSSSLRTPGVRLETAVVPRTQATPVAPGALWLAGEEVPARAWVEIRTTQAGPAYVPLQEVADGSPSLPLTVRLVESHLVSGVAVGAREEPGNSALVTLFRLIDPVPSPSTPSREKPRRVLAAETIADRDGAFHLDGLGDADYEIVAWHPQLGRASILVPRASAPIVIRLESPGTVRGRVVMAGKPLAQADVISLPSPDAFSGADDLVDLKGGDTRTGEDGRFAVMQAAGGGGELRVGGGTLPIRRIPLPRAPVPLLDLGDIDLGSPLEARDRAGPGLRVRPARDRSDRSERPADRHGSADGAWAVSSRPSGSRTVGVRAPLWKRRAATGAGNGPGNAGQRGQGIPFRGAVANARYYDS